MPVVHELPVCLPLLQQAVTKSESHFDEQSWQNLEREQEKKTRNLRKTSQNRAEFIQKSAIP